MWRNAWWALKTFSLWGEIMVQTFQGHSRASSAWTKTPFCKVFWHLPGSFTDSVPIIVWTGSSFSCISMDTCQSTQTRREMLYCLKSRLNPRRWILTQTWKRFPICIKMSPMVPPKTKPHEGTGSEPDFSWTIASYPSSVWLTLWFCLATMCPVTLESAVTHSVQCHWPKVILSEHLLGGWY